jgi:tetratricopeptide (TPR) repeat protein
MRKSDRHRTPASTRVQRSIARLVPEWFAEVAIVLGALAVRMAVAGATWDLPLVQQPQLDSRELLSWATVIASGNHGWPLAPTHGPLYPYFLAGLLTITNDALYDVRLWQAGLGAASVWLVIRLARRFFNRSVALMAGVLVALYGPLVYVETSLYEEGLFVFLLLLTLLLASAPNRWSKAAAGGCLGLAAAARPTALLLLPVLFLTERQHGSPSPVWLRRVLIVGTCVAVLALFAAKSYAVSGNPMLRGYGGLNFYMGNRPGSDGVADARLGQAWDLLQAEPIKLGIENPVAQDRYYLSRALQEIRRQPGAFASVLLRKCIWLVQRTEIRDSHSFQFFASQSLWLRLLPGFALLFPLAAIGLLAAARNHAAPLLLVGYLAVLAGTCIALVVGLRYRVPLMPVLAIFAAYGVHSEWTLARAHRWREAALPLALGAVCTVVAFAKPHRPSLNFAEEYALTGSSLVSQHRLVEAASAYEKAIIASPERALGSNGLGVVALDQGRLEEAERRFREAIAREPGYAAARYHLGVALRQRGDLGGAIREFRQAVQIRPDDGEATSSLADGLLATGRPAEALTYYERLDRFASAPNANLYVAIARANGELGRVAVAEQWAEKATALDPANGDAWFVLSLCQRSARQFDAARQSLSRAASLLGNGVQVRLGGVMLLRAEGRRADAGATLRQVLEDAPDSADARALWIEYAREDGDMQRAEEFLRNLRPASPPR